MVIKMNFILTFDLPWELVKERKMINRELNRIGAKMIQRSMWKFDNLGSLISIANSIKKSGGEARILEERFVF